MGGRGGVMLRVIGLDGSEKLRVGLGLERDIRDASGLVFVDDGVDDRLIPGYDLHQKLRIIGLFPFLDPGDIRSCIIFCRKFFEIIL